MQIRTVQFDVAGVVAASLLNQFFVSLVGTREQHLYKVLASAPMYDVDGCSTETIGVALGYREVAEGFAGRCAIERDMHDFDAPSWVRYGYHELDDKEYHFTELPMGDAPRYYDPVPVFGVCWSPLNRPEDGFVVTNLYPKDIDLTKDGVIKRRPFGMSETDAHKHIGKLPGRIEFTQALSVLHRLNYIQELANIAAQADDDEGEE